jgi:hypothetical protein
MLDRVRRELHQLPALSIRVGGEEHKVYRYRDVLNLAYQHGLVGFEQAAPIQCYRVPGINGGEVVVWVSEVYAVFRDSDGTEYRYHGVGDASVENANRRVAAAGPRLAHTRAKARALADALNLDANLREEFGGDEEDDGSSREPEQARCEKCGAAMSAKSAEVARRIHGKLICYQCSPRKKANA